MIHALTDYSLRSMQESDLDAVLQIESDVHSHPWTRGNFTDSLNAGHQAWVMMLEDKMIGYTVMMLVLDEAHLFNISIAELYQKQGLGQTLLKDMINHAQALGALNMFLEVRASNDSAIGLYEKVGFIEVNVRHGYYQASSGREDAVLMRLAMESKTMENKSESL